jgi:hypothetical protein
MLIISLLSTSVNEKFILLAEFYEIILLGDILYCYESMKNVFCARGCAVGEV